MLKSEWNIFVQVLLKINREKEGLENKQRYDAKLRKEYKEKNGQAK